MLKDGIFILMNSESATLQTLSFSVEMIFNMELAKVVMDVSAIIVASKLQLFLSITIIIKNVIIIIIK